ncbi:C40 family peptidase [Halosquirtibacter xylanolyticus]|uniref:C40 family peptidase n=1 Tax=Halosquirtibacter xylanolyticus TaxID=3374599 RepID=UPI00374879A1|nr:C40 family peptidase [Prolixibacteraceae bacterium]
MNKFGTINCSNISIYKNHNFQSEVVSEVLWGEPFTITESNISWSKIKLLFDQYEGWIPTPNIVYINKESANILDQNQIPVHSFSLHHKITNIDPTKDIHIHLPLGAMIHESSRKQPSLQRIILHMIGVSYKWGGRCSYGIDCSGFTQLLYKFLRIRLPRDAKDQAKVGMTVPFGEHKFGDLAFFGKDEQNITHVGFIESEQMLVHASGVVQKELLTEQGIFNNQGTQTHHLLLIKRIK